MMLPCHPSVSESTDRSQTAGDGFHIVFRFALYCLARRDWLNLTDLLPYTFILHNDIWHMRSMRNIVCMISLTLERHSR